MIIVVRVICYENNEYYPHIFLYECPYELLYYDKIDVSEGIYVNKKVHQKSVILVTIGIS